MNSIELNKVSSSMLRQLRDCRGKRNMCRRKVRSIDKKYSARTDKCVPDLGVFSKTHNPLQNSLE